MSAVGPLYITTTGSVGQGVGGGFMLALGPAVVPATDHWPRMLTPVPLRVSYLVPVPIVQARHSFAGDLCQPRDEGFAGRRALEGLRAPAARTQRDSRTAGSGAEQPAGGV